MTAKEFVKSKYPKAFSKRHKAGKVHYLIFNGVHNMYIGSGKTESGAWVDAKQALMIKEAPTKLTLGDSWYKK